MVLKDVFVLQLKRKCSPAVALHAPVRPDTPLSVMSEPDDVEEQRPDQEAPSVSSPSTAPATAGSTTSKKQKQKKEDDMLDLMQQQCQRSQRLQEVVQACLQQGHDYDRAAWGQWLVSMLKRVDSSLCDTLMQETTQGVWQLVSETKRMQQQKQQQQQPTRQLPAASQQFQPVVPQPDTPVPHYHAPFAASSSAQLYQSSKIQPTQMQAPVFSTRQQTLPQPQIRTTRTWTSPLPR